ncbi:hypothetical protein K7432_004675 [Basidiobolus ranarum]|uniref:Glycoside hydrolase/deacetylase n=1 Tax=Basidiobolus ranarum TaxID=34480 RepID=A0ABR2WXX7_9FUNG
MFNLFLGLLLLAMIGRGFVEAQQCGKQAGGTLCSSEYCCSEFGWCGIGPDYCGSGCQSQCSNVGNSTTSVSDMKTSSSTGTSTSMSVSTSASTSLPTSTSLPEKHRGHDKKKKGKDHKKHKHESENVNQAKETDKTEKQTKKTDGVAPVNNTSTLTGKLLTSCVTPGSVAITYDDGPGMFTEGLLNILANKSVKATFFVIGKQLESDKLRETLKRAYNEGHQIAIHTYDHLALSKLNDTQVWNQTRTASEAIAKVIGKSPKYFRCPYGECSEANLKFLGEKGYRVVQWNLDTNDWKLAGAGNPTKNLQAFKKALKKSNPEKDSFISLMHDVHQGSVNETASVLDYVTSKGYKTVTVAECLNDSEVYF